MVDFGFFVCVKGSGLVRVLGKRDSTIPDRSVFLPFRYLLSLLVMGKKKFGEVLESIPDSKCGISSLN